VAAIVKGVPVGTQVDWLLWMTSGMPIAFTRTEPDIISAVTQGGPTGGFCWHPLTCHGPAMVKAFMPDNLTRGLANMLLACPM
jgi:hypothetical protein